MEFKRSDFRRDHDVQEILGKIPGTFARNLVYVLLGILIAFFIASYYFKYPDMIEAEMIITSTNPPVNLVARQNGKIQDLFVTNNQLVKKDDFLAVIENPAKLTDVIKLIDKVRLFDKSLGSYDSIFRDFNPQLGDIQSSYQNFKDANHQLSIFNEVNYYPQKITAMEAQIAIIVDYKKKVQEQLDLKKEEMKFIKIRANRDSILYENRVLSEYDNESSKIQMLQMLSNIAAIDGTLSNVKAQIGVLKENMLELQLQYEEKKKNLEANLKESFESIKNTISIWEANYLLKTPINGKVIFTNYWNNNQNVKIGDIVLTILPYNKNELKGKALLPALRAGKVKVGQQVKIKLRNYPDVEFGTIKGIINNISEIPINENYILEIKIPNGLKTSYGKVLPSNQDLIGTAMIVSEDLTLFERLFMPVRKFFVNSIN